MDWFLYDTDLRHERDNRVGGKKLVKYSDLQKICCAIT